MKKLLIISFLFISFSSLGQLSQQQVLDSINIKIANNTSRKITEKTLREVMTTIVHYASVDSTSIIPNVPSEIIKKDSCLVFIGDNTPFNTGLQPATFADLERVSSTIDKKELFYLTGWNPEDRYNLPLYSANEAAVLKVQTTLDSLGKNYNKMVLIGGFLHNGKTLIITNEIVKNYLHYQLNVNEILEAENYYGDIAGYEFRGVSFLEQIQVAVDIYSSNFSGRSENSCIYNIHPEVGKTLTITLNAPYLNSEYFGQESNLFLFGIQPSSVQGKHRIYFVKSSNVDTANTAILSENFSTHDLVNSTY